MNLAANFEALQEDCAFINQLEIKHLPRFCKIALRSVIDGEDKDKIRSAAKSLNQDEDIVRNAVRALAQILTMLASASVYIVPQQVYKETLVPMKLSNEASDAIYEYYSTVHNVLRDVLRQFKIETARYHKFDWRLDIQIGSRALHRRVDPVFLCELQTASSKRSKKDNDDSKESDENNQNNQNNQNDIKEFEKTLFECNFATLENMIQQFEQALRETQQSWYRKVERQTK
eukprot:CAMPEP_0201580446 /NCGR_PEP_ID=MMETSP0190_2-20130828/46258_1 /ASSEMBLY_ACC=CAM_ASM_000263 /TAXON_ID=37353 /ORGANISM="Rosalina sp." /LENGTH=230 /DNA_ID=CAMNT_0048016497 /DNA_START=21 /DNA_END=713 /DNA_ORIENTATION=+